MPPRINDPDLSTFRDPRSGQEFSFGDASLNRADIESRGLEFVRGKDPGFTPRPTERLSRLPASSQGGTAGSIPSPFTPERPDKESIFEQKRKQAQGAIDAINTQFNRIIEEERAQGQRNEARTRALNLSQGLAGSEFGTAHNIEAERRTSKAVQLREQERAARIQEILGDVEQRTSEQFQAEREQFLAETEADFERRKEFTEQQRTRALGNMEALAGQGVDIAQFKNQAPDLYRQLVGEAGGGNEFVFDALYNSFKPEGEQRDYQYINLGDGRLARADKKGGGVEFFDAAATLGGKATGQKYTDKVSPDGTLLLIPENIDPSKPLDDQILRFGQEGEFSKQGEEKELDTFTDEKGNRVSVFYNPTTGTTRSQVIGRTGKGSDSGDDEFGAISKSDQAKAKNWLLRQSDHSEADLKQLEEDREFQAWVLQQAELDVF